MCGLWSSPWEEPGICVRADHAQARKKTGRKHTNVLIHWEGITGDLNFYFFQAYVDFLTFLQGACTHVPSCTRGLFGRFRSHESCTLYPDRRP